MLLCVVVSQGGPYHRGDAVCPGCAGWAQAGSCTQRQPATGEGPGGSWLQLLSYNTGRTKDNAAGWVHA